MKIVDAEYIRARLTGKRGEKSALAEAIGQKSDVITKILKGERRVQPNEMSPIAKFFGEDQPGSGQDIVPAILSDKSDVVMVPVYDIAASAGPGTYVDYEVQVAKMTLPRDYLKSLTSSPVDQLAIISVKGDSMAPTLNDGDVVLVDGAKTSGSFDGIFVINFDGTLHVKRLARGSKPGTVRILSDNSAFYPPIDALANDLHIVGRVRWAAGKM